MEETVLRAVTGTVFNVQHYCIHDGPGIRTNVFVKGCPLHCLWCANPESQSPLPQLMYRADSCTGCGACMAACPAGAIHPAGGGKTCTDRTLCTGCGACAAVCPTRARELTGRTVTAGEVFDEVAGDALFYGADGGVTVTGGEALAHPDFTAALLELCRGAGIGTAVETCGFAPWETVKRVLQWCDVVLYDQKHMDSALHRRYTGQGNELILENLQRINDELCCEIWVRVPVIPGCNDSEAHIAQIGAFVKERITRCTQVHLLPFHRLGESKAEQLERPGNGFSATVPEDARMEALREIIRSYGLCCH